MKEYLIILATERTKILHMNDRKDSKYHMQECLSYPLNAQFRLSPIDGSAALVSKL